MSISNSLNILNESEIEELFNVPKISLQDRELFFELTIEDKEYISKQTIVSNKINYILQIGYFRAARKFYKFTFKNVLDDFLYIKERYYPQISIPKSNVSKDKYYASQKEIMRIYKYKRYDSCFAINLEKQAKRLAKRDLTKKNIFENLLNFCEKNNVIRPEYSTLQSIISRAVIREEKRLIVKLGTLLNKASRNTLDDLIASSDTISNLSLLKKDPKGLTTTEMEAELTKQQNISELFEKSKHIIPTLDISRQNLQYYADLCDYYDVHILKSFNQKKSRLYMICLVWQRFVKLNDHLITFYVHKTKSYEDSNKNHVNTCILEAKININVDQKLASKMLKIVHDNSVEDKDIRTNCYKIVSEDKFDNFTNKLAKPNLDASSYEWIYYDKEHGSIKRNLRPIFMGLTFNCKKDKDLNDAIEYAKKHFRSIDKTKDPIAQNAPLSFISKRSLKYITYKKKVEINKETRVKKKINHIDIKRYEIILYKYISEAICNGNIFITDSINYRSLEDELIPLDIWEKNSKKILKGLSDCINITPIHEILNNLEVELSESYKILNKRIKSGENKDIKIDAENCTWKLPYKKVSDTANNPYYEKFKTTGIANVIDFTALHTNFYDSFTHILNKNSKLKAKPEHIKAYLVSQGEGIGHKKVAESSDVSYKNLTDIEGKFIRIDTLVKAGDIVIDKISKLPIFNHYNLSDYGIHASLDGQKIETKYQTILSRYSTKYFGYGKGVVSYSLIANHLPVSTKIIGANEHESHYVLDIVYNNSSNLKIKAVSGDMHSINRVNFSLMYLFGYDFIPRFTKINLKADKNLVAFKGMQVFNNDLIKPANYVNKQLIIDEWNNIQRILASLANKNSSQSTIVRKLSSFSKKNKTLKALIELDKIILSIYMLKYINSIDMRRSVHRVLNRGEAFHQLRSALFQVSGKKILGKSEKALEVSNQCNRLLTCCIIYYNATLLSELLRQAEAKGDQSLCEKIKRLSPVAWQHISFLGNFVFSAISEPIDIKGIIEKALLETGVTKEAESLAT